MNYQQLIDSVSAKKLHLNIKNVYGKELLYPACSFGKMICKLKGTTTITQADILILESAGYEVKILNKLVEMD